MSGLQSRRQFLVQTSSLAAAASVPAWLSAADPSDGKARVVIARDEALCRGKVDEHRPVLQKLLDASILKLTGKAESATAWSTLFKPDQRIGIKVNTLGLSTQPAVVDAIVAGLRGAGVPAGNIIIWDRFDVELDRAGFKLNRSGTGVRCFGTDAQSYGSGYQGEIETSGEIGSCFSRIVADQVDALISVPVLKDHNLAGVSLGMKNFYGAIHNPNKYHERNCDPYIVDVVSHRFIRPKWRLTVCDATRAQYHGGPSAHPGFAWKFGGVILGRDVVAVDAVCADLLERQRKEHDLKTLQEEKRPCQHIATAGNRGLGVADLKRIETVEV